MDRQEVKEKTLRVIEQLLQDGFKGEITEETSLIILFGKNEWYTLGILVINAELRKEFARNIPVDLYGCNTVGEFINFITHYINSSTTVAESYQGKPVKEFAYCGA